MLSSPVFQQYQKLFTQLLKRFNLLTYSNVNEFHSQAKRRVCVRSAPLTRFDSIVFACSLVMHAIDTYPIFHPSSIITIHQHIIIVVPYLSEPISYEKVNQSLWLFGLYTLRFYVHHRHRHRIQYAFDMQTNR